MEELLMSNEKNPGSLNEGLEDDMMMFPFILCMMQFSFSPILFRESSQKTDLLLGKCLSFACFVIFPLHKRKGGLENHKKFETCTHLLYPSGSLKFNHLHIVYLLLGLKLMMMMTIMMMIIIIIMFFCPPFFHFR